MNAAAILNPVQVRPRSTTAATILLALGRGAAVGFFSLLALVEMFVTTACVRREQPAHARAAWLHRWCRVACRILGLRLTMIGRMPQRGLLICNHLGYLDIIALSSIQPCVFVAKREVAGWPVFGWLARAAGTIFVDRNHRCQAGAVISRIKAAVGSGLLVVLFPEGTSSDGATVLPFKSSLLEPAVQLDDPITAGAIEYSLREGSVADEVCYWRDMTLVPHLANLFAKPAIDARIAFADFPRRGLQRKQLARELRQQVIAMRTER